MSKHVPMFFLMTVLTLAILGGMVCAAPLTVHPTNPRYFTDGSGKAILLSGFEYWDALAEGGYEPASDFMLYSDFLNAIRPFKANLIRLWMYYEATKFKEVWQRTGPGYALDGRPKFDLTKFNQTYFDELRSRVVQARDEGYYVAVMFFEGTSGHLDQEWWDNHPFNGVNNINGVDAGVASNVHTLAVPSVTNVQKEYVKKVIDTVNDLDNVLYEIINEAGSFSTDWQYYMINFVKNYEAGKPKRHPVGMSFQYPGGSNSILFASPADWIAPNPEGGYATDPPAANGSKVIIADTDHIQSRPAVGRDWAWKSFTRGLNLLAYLELYEISDSNTANFPVRKAMGHTLTYANKMNLTSMTPQNSLSSTSYCLANPGSEYLVYQPGSGSFTVNLQAGTYSYEWFNPGAGSVAGTGTITASGGSRSFSPPFSGDAVLYLKAGSAEPYCGDVSCNNNETCSSCPSDCGACPSANPVAHFKLDETSGTIAADSSGNGNNGTLVNGPVWTTGKIGGALSFDGVDDYVKVLNISLPGAMTIAFWVNTPSSGAGTWRAIIGADSNDKAIFVSNAEKLMVVDNPTVVVTSVTSVPAGQWVHGVYTWDGTNSNIYFNGVLDATSITAPFTNIATIGTDQSFHTDETFKGQIDDIRIYNRVLNQSEIQALYQNGSCVHKSDSSCDGCVSIAELTAYIDRWYANNQDVTLKELIESIGFWKRGGC